MGSAGEAKGKDGSREVPGSGEQWLSTLMGQGCEAKPRGRGERFAATGT